MFKNILASLMITAAFGAPSAYAHGAQSQPSLLGALVAVGNHGSVANIAATVAAPSTLANVHANVLGNSVNANVNVGASSHNSYTPAPSHASSSVADVNLNVLNVVKANVDVGQSAHQGSSLLNLNASLLSGGVGNRQGW